MTEQILGWAAAAVAVGGAVKYIRDYRKIGAPTPGFQEPFSDPEMKQARENVAARMQAAGIKNFPASEP